MSSENFMTSRMLKDRYRCSDMTLHRWERHPTLDFPKPLRINGRRLWREADIAEWELQRSGRAAA